MTTSLSHIDTFFKSMIRHCSERLIDFDVIESPAQVGVVKFDPVSRCNYYTYLFTDVYDSPYCHPELNRIYNTFSDIRNEMREKYLEDWKRIINKFYKQTERIETAFLHKNKGIVIKEICNILKQIPFEFPVTEEIYTECYNRRQGSSYRLLNNSHRFKESEYFGMRRNAELWILGCDIESEIFPHHRVYSNTFFKLRNSLYALVIFCESRFQASEVGKIEPYFRKLSESFEYFTFGRELFKEQLYKTIKLTLVKETIYRSLTDAITQKESNARNEILALLERISQEPGQTLTSKENQVLDFLLVSHEDNKLAMDVLVQATNLLKENQK